jgi:F-type H+-transporting ATPase subunit b
MPRLSRVLGWFALALGLAATAPAFADDEPAHDATAEQHADDDRADAAPGALAHSEGEHAAHGEGHEHAPSFDDVNWFYGFLGEKAGEEPSLMWRPKGMPVPFGALALDAAILYFLLIKFGRKPIGDGLRQRKLSIMKGMDDAAKMKAAAQARLDEYEQKLASIDEEVARIRRDAKEAADAESARILSEAKERRARMERDARTLIEQELKAAREGLLRETVRGAMKTAEATLTAKVGDSDQQRLAEEYLGSIKASGAALRGRL